MFKEECTEKEKLLGDKYFEDLSEQEELILGVKYFREKKYDMALIHLEKAAEYDNGEAEYDIGVIYEFMHSFKDLSKAEKWYSLSEQHGYHKATLAKNKLLKRKKQKHFCLI